MRKTGTIHLVGAGPGPVDLLTLRAARLISGARVIVHDGLIGPDILVAPGISAANGAAPASAIALTHRDASSIVSVVAGQCKGLAEQDWSGLAGKGRTLVIYMGVSTAAQIAEKLMGDGLAPDMPVAVIENAARPEMRVLRGLLAALPDLVEREAVKSPALIVIGEVTARSFDASRHPSGCEAQPEAERWDLERQAQFLEALGPSFRWGDGDIQP